LSDSAQNPIKRRTALARLGLTAVAIYAAPSVVHLDRSANAQVRPSCNSKGKGNPWCKTKGKGKSKGKSKGGGGRGGSRGGGRGGSRGGGGGKSRGGGRSRR
jgi:hypothetical protein